MSWDWAAVNQTADDALVVVGIAVLIARQFIWRPAQLHRMLRLPLILIGAGMAYLVVELSDEGFRWVPGDRVILGELALVALTGTAMGYVTRFRTYQDHLQYKLTAPGIGLWLIFVAIRIGSLYLAAALGANLGDTTGLILLSFGLNRLAAVLIVRRRARDALASAPHDVDVDCGA
ncbi:MAG TPA: hypothetical protein VMY76_06970, partial [Gemmatimonadales bacterium]|nr:hypothetical protein [Gemmatimonadales bacterium]